MRTVTTIDIERPAADVFAYVADMANNPKWQDGMESCVWTSALPIGVGSTYDQVAKFLGKEIRTSFEVTEFEIDHHIRIKSVVSTFPLDIARDVEATSDASCRVTAIVAGEPTGVMKLTTPFTKPMVARSVRKDYQKLKGRLEGSRP